MSRSLEQGKDPGEKTLLEGNFEEGGGKKRDFHVTRQEQLEQVRQPEDGRGSL